MSRILLAPMEGLADSLLRDLLTRVAGYDGVVTQFVRVSGSLLPARAFRRVAPELDHGGRTSSGVPATVQLLGSDPARMAENAARLAGLGPAGVDLNFGCPAPTVNRHGGGASLLADPRRLHDIAAAVRAAVPVAMPVSAKMRLGIDDTSPALECALALAAAGVSSLVVHARTRAQCYRPPAHWEWIARIRETVAVPVIANGDIWSVDDYRRCREVSGCADVMIGRGAVADPFLVRRLRASLCAQTGAEAACDEWKELLPLLAEFWARVQFQVLPAHAPGRLKLWLNWLRRDYPQAEALYRALRSLRRIEEVDALLLAHGASRFVATADGTSSAARCAADEGGR